MIFWPLGCTAVVSSVKWRPGLSLRLMEKIVLRQSSDGFCITEGRIHQVSRLFLINNIILREVIVFLKEKHLQTIECTYSMEQNSAWEAIRFSSTQKIVPFLSLVSVQYVENVHHFIALPRIWCGLFLLAFVKNNAYVVQSSGSQNSAALLWRHVVG
jgi:hypothetical protein